MIFDRLLVLMLCPRRLLEVAESVGQRKNVSVDRQGLDRFAHRSDRMVAYLAFRKPVFFG